jgi:hypothetical protein
MEAAMFILSLCFILLFNNTQIVAELIPKKEGQKLKTEEAETKWNSAMFLGITVGETTRSEVIQILGNPATIGTWDWDDSKKPKYRLYHYKINNKYKGDLTVEIETQTNKVLSMDLTPEEMSIKQATDFFGEDYKPTRYDFCDCSFAKGSPIFESPQGDLLYFEYKRKGIAISINEQAQVSVILFVNKPIGLKSAIDCKKYCASKK